MNTASCPQCNSELCLLRDYPASDEPDEAPAGRPFACPRCRAVIVFQDPAARWAFWVTGALYLVGAVALCVRFGWWGGLAAIALAAVWFIVYHFVAVLAAGFVPEYLEAYRLDTSAAPTSIGAREENVRETIARIADQFVELARLEAIPQERIQQLRKLVLNLPGREVLESGASTSKELAAELAKKEPDELEVDRLRRELLEVATVLRLLASGSDVPRQA